ncbi:hypothetical protein EVG20_g6286 [Dentipellis fragilis]|uniref:Uncharacterized protein n=1 Tax=Dentipellis fragilis TaxID=205917 RepID=A0A4Y9YLZ7_9AGAM|nr:hypothetical protein EVG20_g6286 [Dentipellis fragilis]
MAASDPKQKCSETLEVETEEERMSRLQNTFASLSSASAPAEDGVGTRPFDFGKRETFAVPPPTDLLARVQAFLPALKASNTELAQKDPQSVDIENVGEEEGQYIEMNLGLGVFEQRKQGATSSESESSEDQQMDAASARSDSDSDSDSYSDTSSEDDIITTIAKAARPTKPLPRRARPQIEVLGSAPSTPDGAPES